jgi:hypothetical protein
VILGSGEFDINAIRIALACRYVNNLHGFTTIAQVYINVIADIVVYNAAPLFILPNSYTNHTHILLPRKRQFLKKIGRGTALLHIYSWLFRELFWLCLRKFGDICPIILSIILLIQLTGLARVYLLFILRSSSWVFI